MQLQSLVEWVLNQDSKMTFSCKDKITFLGSFVVEGTRKARKAQFFSVSSQPRNFYNIFEATLRNVRAEGFLHGLPGLQRLAKAHTHTVVALERHVSSSRGFFITFPGTRKAALRLK